MAVIGNAEKISSDGAFELGRYVIRQQWRVKVTSLDDDEIVVCNAPGLPLLFDPYPTLPVMRVRSYEDVKRVAIGAKAWTLTVIFATPENKGSSSGPGGSGGGGGGPGGGSGGGTGQETSGEFENPLLELPAVKFHSTSREDNLTQIYDVNTGTIKPVTGSNGEPYDPPPKYLQRSITLEIARNEDINAPHPALAVRYTNTVNSDVFWGCAPGVWFCKDISADRQVRQVRSGPSVPFLRVTYQFEGRPDWDIVLLDSGSYYLLPPAASTSNPYLPFLPAANPWVPFIPAAAGAATMTLTTFRRRQFMSAEGHPVHGPLNGQGGALPQACTFTLNQAASTITAPAATATAPGVWTNGMAVQLWATDGSLPRPLSPTRVYYVVNLQSDGRTFRLAATNAASGTTKRCAYDSGFPNLEVASPGNRNGVEVGMLAVGTGIPAGTTVIAVGPQSYAITLSANATQGTDVGRPLDVIFVRAAGPPITFTTAGSGVMTIMPLGVFNRIRPYDRLPFAALGLPQSFNEVQ